MSEEQTITTLSITIDGQQVEVSSGTSILDACKQAGKDIPTLCNEPRLKPSGQCGMCLVEVNGAVITSCDRESADGMSICTMSAEIASKRKATLTELLKNHNAYCTPPCTNACPARINVPGYIGLISEKKYVEATALIKEKLPLPGILGRVCPHPCEDVCRRDQLDSPVAICSLKRYAADKARVAGYEIAPDKADPSGKKVAVVGSGPAGLSAAYYLALQGHEIVIYESREHAGGMLRYGIPSYRLPDAIIDQEVQDILDLGPKLVLNHTLGKDMTIGTLSKDFDAVFLSFGATLGKKMGVDGEEAPGIVSAVDFLEEVNKRGKATIGKNVVVIGGGFTAMDAARTAKRLGAEKVTVVYRRTKDKMPASPQEVHETEAEGVEMVFLAAPKAVVTDDNSAVKALTVIDMKLDMAGGGRGALVEVPGSEREFPTDMVLLAIGQDVENEVFEDEINVSKWNTVAINDKTFATSIPGIFSAGDCVTGPATVVEAVAGGRRSADAIDLYLKGFKSDEIALLLEQFEPTFFDIGASRKEKSDRQKMAERTPEERLKDFEQVELGFSDEAAHVEADRCLQCACQENGACKLQKYSIEYGAGTTEFAGPLPAEPLTLSAAPFFQLDKEKCIKCYNCVRMCNENMHYKVYKIGDDGYPSIFGKTYQDTECVFCGNCISVCPTGALKDLLDVGTMPKDLRKQVSTVCSYCGVGCGITYEVEGEKIVSARGNSNHAVNRGSLCIKGKFGFTFNDSPERLSRPKIRESLDQEFREVSWDEAIKFVADKFKYYHDTFGGDSCGVLSSSRGTNEENYVAQKLARAVLGTHNIDNCARVCHAPTVQGLRAAFGSGAATNPLRDLEGADVLLVTGSNTTEGHPVAGMMLKQALNNGAKLIVIDPRKTEIAAKADIHLQIKPGTNIAVLNSIANVIIEEGLMDQAFIDDRTENYDMFQQIVRSYSPEDTQATTGVDPDLVRQAARLYATAGKASMVHGLGVSEHKFGSHGVMCLANLALLTGNVGKPNTGVNPLRGQNNVQGSCDMGSLPGVYVGYQIVDSEEFRLKFSEAYGREMGPHHGLKEPDMYRAAIKGDVKAMYIIGYDPAKTNAHLNFITEGLKALEFLVVQDIFPVETMKFAHAILPAASFLEKSGTFTNAERRISLLRPAVPIFGEAKKDWEITCQIATAMGYPMHYANEAAIMDEIARLAPYFAGVSYERLETQDLIWPVMNKDTIGTPVMHTKTFTRGKGKFNDMPYFPSEELPDDEYPLYLTTGRRLEHYNNGSMTLRCPEILERCPEELAEISPFDAEKLGIEDGQLVTVESRRAAIIVKAKITEKSPPGVVFLSFHFDEPLVNFVTGPGEDVEVATPEYKVCAVKVSSKTS